MQFEASPYITVRKGAQAKRGGIFVLDFFVRKKCALLMPVAWLLFPRSLSLASSHG